MVFRLAVLARVLIHRVPFILIELLATLSERARELEGTNFQFFLSNRDSFCSTSLTCISHNAALISFNVVVA